MLSSGDPKHQVSILNPWRATTTAEYAGSAPLAGGGIEQGEQSRKGQPPAHIHGVASAQRSRRILNPVSPNASTPEEHDLAVGQKKEADSRPTV